MKKKLLLAAVICSTLTISCSKNEQVVPMEKISSETAILPQQSVNASPYDFIYSYYSSQENALVFDAATYPINYVPINKWNDPIVPVDNDYFYADGTYYLVKVADTLKMFAAIGIEWVNAPLDGLNNGMIFRIKSQNPDFTFAVSEEIFVPFTSESGSTLIRIPEWRHYASAGSLNFVEVGTRYLVQRPTDFKMYLQSGLGNISYLNITQ